jgi:hypothetical protein
MYDQIPIAVSVLAAALLAVYLACIAAKDLAVLLLRATGHLPGLPVYGAARSGKWKAKEEQWLELHPNCAACGGTRECVGHHKDPFHLHPEEELDPANLITLCNYHGCHLAFGHNYDWHAHNPHVELDAARQLQRTKNRRYA